MNFLFVHQNMPGQYRELIQWLTAQKEHQIVFLTQRKKAPQFDVEGPLTSDSDTDGGASSDVGSVYSDSILDETDSSRTKVLMKGRNENYYIEDKHKHKRSDSFTWLINHTL